MSTKARSELKLTALFHDAEEAYWGDMIKPLKEIVKLSAPEILIKQNQLRDMIFNKFHIKKLDYKELDWSELIWEFDNLILHNNINTMYPERAERNWLRRYKLLINPQEEKK